MTCYEFIHLEAVHPRAFEQDPHLFIANDLSPGIRVLQIIGLDVDPKLLYNLRAR